MTADINRPAPDVEVVPPDAEGLPAEWVIWAAAIERSEDLRFRVAKKAERVRFTEALAQHTAQRGMLDWTEETLDFVAQLRAGTDRPELHTQSKRRWSLNRQTRGGGAPR